jgi:tetratricopeptide (TPR) repeat protein
MVPSPHQQPCAPPTGHALRPRRPAARILVPLLALTLAGPAVADKWYEHYERAEEAIRNEQWQEAVNELTEAILKNDTPGVNLNTYGMNFLDYHPYLKLGIAYHNLGQHEMALNQFSTEESFGEVAKSRDNLAELQRFRGLAEQGKVDADARHAEEQAQIFEDFLSEAAQLEQADRLDDAIEAAGRALAMDEQNPRALELIERLQGLAAERDRQRQIATRADALVQQGRERVAAGNYEEASSLFSQALALRPSTEVEGLLADSQAAYGRQLQEERDASERRAMVADGLDDARRLEADGALVDSIQRLQQVLALEPDNQKAIELRDRVLEAQATLEREEQRTTDIARLIEEGRGLLEAGDPGSAMQRLSRAMGQDRGNQVARQLFSQAVTMMRESGLTVQTVAAMPPILSLENSANVVAVEGAEAEEVLRTASVTLRGSVVDDDPSIEIRYEGPDGSLATETLDGTRYLGNLWKLDFSRTFPLDPGAGDWAITVVDSDGSSDVIAHRVRYLRPWFRSPVVQASGVAGVLALGAGAALIRVQRRRRLRTRRYNPYVAGAPILGDQLFFGRAHLMERVLQTVHNNSILLYGERRIGKTSFQHHLKRRLEQLDDPEFHFYPVFIDLQGTPEEKFFATLSEDIFDQLEPLLGGLEAPRMDDGGAPYTYTSFTADLRRVMRQLKKQATKGVKLVMLIDECDELNYYDPKINQKLRSLFMKSFAENLVCVVSGVGIKKQWESEGSPWYNFFEEIAVTPIDDRYARELVEQPIKGVFALEDGVVDRILSRTECKPYLIQKTCMQIVSRLYQDNRKRITLADVDAVSDQLEI